jgi:hypothetical protein
LEPVLTRAIGWIILLAQDLHYRTLIVYLLLSLPR